MDTVTVYRAFLSRSICTKKIIAVTSRQIAIGQHTSMAQAIAWASSRAEPATFIPLSVKTAQTPGMSSNTPTVPKRGAAVALRP